MLFLFMIVLLISGCGCNGEKKDNNGGSLNNNVDNSENELEHYELFFDEEYEGLDPIGIPRYPNSLRTGYIEEKYAFYIVEDVLEEVGKFYRDFADENDYIVDIQTTDEEGREIFVMILRPETISPEAPEYVITLFESEEYANYIEFKIWSDNWKLE